MLKQEMRSNKATRKNYLTIEHTAGQMVTIYLAVAILNHHHSIEYATKFLDTFDVAPPVTGLQRFEKFQNMFLSFLL